MEGHTLGVAIYLRDVLKNMAPNYIVMHTLITYAVSLPKRIWYRNVTYAINKAIKQQLTTYESYEVLTKKYHKAR
jgi:cell shape-determining protein MreC